ncbi:hypothetical protein BDZ94DRAFT_1240172 [Collybia nuda]|uniref:Defect at low temperature protein 1 n=1 Tax=Collybia nuda TaxID=64659 RepID=A0A9P5XUW4_9AGAR|nr:hypothetical protein BDZ94DRAFT_1240172 [Collybia nuda]
MLSSRLILLRTASESSYALLILITIVATGLSCAALLSQAVRTAPNQSWAKNVNALVVGASYAVVLIVSLLYCVKRRIAVRLKLQRISKMYKTIGRNDLPELVHTYTTKEYVRACLVSYECLPKDAFHEGWGRPGTKNSGIRFRRQLLNTVLDIDALAHIIIPTLPKLKPHGRVLHHFRFILPLLPLDEDGLTPLHYYDSAVHLARISHNELTESEFELGMLAASDIIKCLNECRLEMMEDSSTQLS